ncbi:hypothetical protein [Bifidobacterium sp.]|uniref:hypothetical protein n=1 Tax=Bifidobacterium sp. TaxID=41200 RepID=UPI003D7E3044
MDNQLFHPIIPEGMHLAKPHDNPNAVLGSLFDEGNHLYGQARWEIADAGDEDDSRAPYAALAVGVLIGAATVGTAVYLAKNEKVRGVWDRTVGHWWNHAVAPAANKIKARLFHSRNDGNKSVRPVALLTDGSENVDGFSKEVDDAIEDCRLNMDSEEAQNRLLVIMYKAMDLAREIRALSEANIRYAASDKERDELQRTMEKLATQDMADIINKALERNIPLLEQQKDSDAWSDILKEMTDGEKVMQVDRKSLQSALALEPRRVPVEGPNPKNGQVHEHS